MIRLRAVVLGAAAGGGFPQWNCACPLCRRARDGDPDAIPCSQCSLAVSADGIRWTLLNAAPELTMQIARTNILHPPGPGRGSPIAAVVLTSGEIEAITGLLSLREGHSFAIYAGNDVLHVLDANPIFAALQPLRVPRRELRLAAEMMLCDAAGLHLDVTVTAFAVPGKVPLFAETGNDPGPADEGATIGLQVSAGETSLFFIPGCAAMTDALQNRLRGAALVLFDGTLWRDDEMIAAGLGEKTGRRMGHMSISGPSGAMAALADLNIRRRVLIHLNNTNPALLDCSPERANLVAAGWEVAADRMELPA
jgi:pyrroloquinoline quinone biosynthesis protein B